LKNLILFKREKLNDVKQYIIVDYTFLFKSIIDMNTSTHLNSYEKFDIGGVNDLEGNNIIRVEHMGATHYLIFF